MTVVPPSILASQDKKTIFKRKYYAHLDAIRSPDCLFKAIKNPNWVCKHGFLPFVHAVLKTKKRIGKHQTPEWKPRHIYYASHMDRYVYQWYAHLTAEAYEKYIADNHFDQSPIAYRQGLEKNNVHFSTEVFRFIRTKKDCFVYISDFTSFFDTLSHKLLKEKVRKIFCVSELPEDHYRIFKSMTRFRYFDLDDIAAIAGQTTKELRGKNTKPAQLLTSEQMRAKKQQYLKSNLNKDPYGVGVGTVGVPQGSPISAVYANVYMIDFDKNMTDYVDRIGGIYRRYSDDLICVVPPENEAELLSILETNIQDARVKISEKKTKFFHVKQGIPFRDTKSESGSTETRTSIEYLGLSFDGISIKLKPGTLNKYYNKLNRRLHLMKQKSVDFGKVIGRKKVYKKLSHLGEANRRHQQMIRGTESPLRERNFFTYAYLASEIAEDPEIRKQLKGHMKRIGKFYEEIGESVVNAKTGVRKPSAF